MKRLSSFLLTLVLAAGFASAQTPTETLNQFNAALEDFLVEINTALPDNAVVGGAWSDAYIGQIVGIPPHFGAGVAAGVSRFPVTALKTAIELTGEDLPVEELVLPNFAIEGRIGGFLLPFDIGLRGGLLPELQLNDVTIGYMNFGADVRYALLKGNLAMPSVSVGLGYYYTSGSVSYMFDPNDLVDFNYPGAEEPNLPDQELAIDFSTQVIEAKAQISKGLIIATPYLGAAASLSMSEATYKLINQTKTVSTADDPQLGMRIYGGTSFNLLLLKIDLTGMYNILSRNWGANLGARIQL